MDSAWSRPSRSKTSKNRKKWEAGFPLDSWSATSVHVARGNMRLGLKILLDLGARALAIPNRAPPLKRSLCEKQRTATPPSLAALASGSFSSQWAPLALRRRCADRRFSTVIRIGGQHVTLRIDSIGSRAFLRAKNQFGLRASRPPQTRPTRCSTRAQPCVVTVLGTSESNSAKDSPSCSHAS